VTRLPRTAAVAAFALIAALAAARPTRAAELPPPKGYVCPRAAQGVRVDGELNDPAWQSAPWTDDFVDIEGDRKPRPRFRTRVKMLWDDQFFYVAAEAEEPNVWGTLTKHDSVIFHDNDFEVFIDPDGDNHGYYELEINALNTEWDLLLRKPYRDGGPAVDAWEVPGLKTGTHVAGTLNDGSDRDTGWTVELAIPWVALAEHANRPSPPKPGDQWRVNFSRVEWETVVAGKATTKVPGRKEDNWVWTPQDAVDMHRPERWGFVQFADGPATPFRPDPTLAARDRLMGLYAAEKAYQTTHKVYTASIADLERLGGVNPTLRLTEGGYEATLPVGGVGGEGPKVVKVREDSRLTVEPARP